MNTNQKATKMNTNNSPFQDAIEYTIGSHFACAISNNDYTGLDGNEGNDLDSFLDAIGDGVWDFSDNADMGICEISGYAGNVITAKFSPYK